MALGSGRLGNSRRLEHYRKPALRSGGQIDVQPHGVKTSSLHFEDVMRRLKVLERKLAVVRRRLLQDDPTVIAQGNPCVGDPLAGAIGKNSTGQSHRRALRKVGECRSCGRKKESKDKYNPDNTNPRHRAPTVKLERSQRANGRIVLQRTKKDRRIERSGSK